MSKKRGQEPLLFINQPISKTPSNQNMQEVYTNRNEREQQKEDNHKVETKKMIKKEVMPDDMAMEAAKKETKSHQEKNHSSFSRVKPFKEMNIKERIEYLLNFPKVLPPPPCVIYTSDNRYQGILIEYTDNRVTIQSPDQSTNTILLEDIKNVIMIGIKR